MSSQANYDEIVKEMVDSGEIPRDIEEAINGRDYNLPESKKILNAIESMAFNIKVITFFIVLPFVVSLIFGIIVLLNSLKH